jgi:hypothetical protein
LPAINAGCCGIAAAHDQSVMDMGNNAVGRPLSGATHAALQTAVIQALTSGTLTILDNFNTSESPGLLIPSDID